MFERSRQLFEKANEVFPGGVNSPVRAFNSVGGVPPFIAKTSGSHLIDVDGNTYVDYVGSWGPAILGHTHSEVIQEVTRACQNGLTFGAPCEAETKLGEFICAKIPSIEKIRLVSSGTEACMSAIRLARAFTEKSKIIKFNGNYHGHADMLLAKAGSGVATLGIPDCNGVTKESVSQTVTLPYNDVDAFESAMSQMGRDIACVIVEPIAGNCGFIKPERAFLESLRKQTTQAGALLIFDEVMTGFRVGLTGAQGYFDIKPDLTTFGKVIGGGMPLAAYGGRKDIMSMIAPEGPVYQAGTLSGNPVAVAAGLKTLEILHREPVFSHLEKYLEDLGHGLIKLANEYEVPFQFDSVGGMFGFFFSKNKVKNFQQAQTSNNDLFREFFRLMLNQGVYLAPSAFEAGFVSYAHSSEDLDRTLYCANLSFQQLKV